MKNITKCGPRGKAAHDIKAAALYRPVEKIVILGDASQREARRQAINNDPSITSIQPIAVHIDRPELGLRAGDEILALACDPQPGVVVYVTNKRRDEISHFGRVTEVGGGAVTVMCYCGCDEPRTYAPDDVCRIYRVDFETLRRPSDMPRGVVSIGGRGA